tara:strand:- start:237 stop:920 length:684 start_codon:yes stop_codon:yes gene_type:complete
MHAILIFNRIFKIFLLFVATLVHIDVSANDNTPGYAYDSYGKVIVDGFGYCIRTNYSSLKKIPNVCAANSLEKNPEITFENSPSEQMSSKAEYSEKENLDKIVDSDETTEGLNKSSYDPILTEVKFNFDKFNLTEKAKLILIEFSKKTVNVDLNMINILGYADALGSNNYNIQLSVKRANTVKNFLTQNGVSKNKITITGKGESNPVADNTTREGRAENRRVIIELQ